MVKRKDFNATLKQLTDCLERMCSGNRFHSDDISLAFLNKSSQSYLLCYLPPDKSERTPR